MKKYILTEETKRIWGTTLHRIRAIRDFKNVKEGDLGGWIESENNLSHEGNAWVFDNAQVWENARVFDNAEVHGNAWVHGNARLYDKASVSGNAKVCANVNLHDNAKIYGDTVIYGNADICGDGEVTSKNNWFAIDNIGSRDSTTTFFTDKNKGISVSCGCFLGSLEEFAEAVKETHGDNRHAKEYMAAIEMAKARIL